MSENKKKILEMLAAGKISVDDATKLLSALGEESTPDTEPKSCAGQKIKYLRVTVDGMKHDRPDAPEKVNIRVPVALIRAGMKFSSLIPKEASEQVDDALRDAGVNLNIKKLKEEDLDVLLAALDDLRVEVDNGRGHVWIRTE